MNWKLTSLFLLLVCLAVMISGCNQGAQNTVPTSSKISVAAGTETVAIPSDEPALMGRVKEIIGNEVTIVKITVPDISGRTAADQERPAKQIGEDEAGVGRPFAGNAESPGTTDDQIAERPAPADMPRLEPIENEEESETFLIPAGAVIAKTAVREEGATVLTLSDITAGSMIRVWKTNDAISFVQVMGSGNVRSRNSENESGQQFPGGPPGNFGGGGMPPGSNRSGITQSLGGGR